MDHAEGVALELLVVVGLGDLLVDDGAVLVLGVGVVLIGPSDRFGLVAILHVGLLVVEGLELVLIDL